MELVRPTKHPECNGNLRKLCKNECSQCFIRSFANSKEADYWSQNNGDITPRDVFRRSDKEYKFICPVVDCKHEFKVTPDHINSRGDWCPYCSHHRLCGNENCDMCRNNSFASSPKVDCWSPNNVVKPIEVFLNSNAVYKFICPAIDCKHEFESTVANINAGHWCPYCGVGPKKLCSDEHCKSCKSKSFASHPKSLYWSPNNKVSPRDVFKCASVKYKFICPRLECGHEFETTLSKIAESKWCSFCGKRQLCDKDDCLMCFDNSFASSLRADCWSPNNKLRPRDVFLRTGNIYKFVCKNSKCRREFEKSPNAIFSGGWCPYCKHKTESKLYEFLLTIFSEHMVQKRYAPDWCKNPETGKHLPFDFLLVFLNIIIELDGPQHFVQVSNWAPPEETQKTDTYKEERAHENGKTVIRLLQTDVLHDKTDWRSDLVRCLKYIFVSPVTVYLYEGVERIPVTLVFVD